MFPSIIFSFSSELCPRATRSLRPCLAQLCTVFHLSDFPHCVLLSRSLHASSGAVAASLLLSPATRSLTARTPPVSVCHFDCQCALFGTERHFTALCFGRAARIRCRCPPRHSEGRTIKIRSRDRQLLLLSYHVRGCSMPGEVTYPTAHYPIHKCRRK